MEMIKEENILWRYGLDGWDNIPFESFYWRFIPLRDGVNGGVIYTRVIMYRDYELNKPTFSGHMAYQFYGKYLFEWWG
jgi:hypothetical protein